MSYYRGMTCENVTLKGDGGTPITAYTAKPAGSPADAGRRSDHLTGRQDVAPWRKINVVLPRNDLR